jgi:hypothetical protein
MKRLFLSLFLLALACGAQAQFAPNTVLTATALNNALAAPTITAGSINGSTSITTSGAVTLNGVTNLGATANATTLGYLDSSTKLATTAFTRQTVLAASATLPFSVTGGSGTYNFASAGTGAIFGVTTSGGAIATISGIVAGGSGYQVGDCLVMVGGNGDAIVYVATVSSGAVASTTVLYGGTGYTGTPQLTGSALPPGSRSGAISGTLAGNVTVIVPAGTLLAGARRFSFQNNTTGAFSITVKLSNGLGGSTGTGVILPQGTANSTSVTLYTNGVTDVWTENGAAQNFIVPGTFTLQGVNVLPNLSATSASLGGGSLAGNTCTSNTTTVTGATTAMAVFASPTTYPGDAFVWKSYVSAANTITTLICNTMTGASTPTASTYKLRVIQ